MAELVTLTTAEPAPATTVYQLGRVLLDVTTLTVRIELVGDTGKPKVIIYGPTTTPTGATILHALNTGNFSTTSLAKKIYQQLQSDGLIPGTISGTPL